MFGILTVAIFLPAAMGLPVYVLGRRNIRLARLLGVGTTAAELVVTLIILGVFSYGIGGFQLAEKVDWAISFGLTYHVALDGISLPLLLIATILSFLAAYGSTDLIKEREPEYYALFLLFETGIIGVFTSLDLILFYVFWEIVLVPMFFFVGIWGGPRKKYASMKFLIFTYTGSVIMLFGFLAVYAWTSSQGNPTFDYTELVGRVGVLALLLQLAASIATFVGFAVKLPIVPFHTWLPDAHVEAPAPVSVLLAGLLLKMGGYGLIRFNLLFFPAATNVLWPYFAAIGLVTMIYGASVAIVQRDLKRMIAMTSINNMGYVLWMLRRVVMTPGVGARNEISLHSLAILAAFLIPLFVLGAYPGPLLDSIIRATTNPLAPGGP